MAKQNMGVTLRRDVVEEIDRRRGMTPRSAYVEALLVRALGEAVPKRLRGARVRHAATPNPAAGKTFVSSSMLFFSEEGAKAAGDRVDTSVPWTVAHNLVAGGDELPAKANIEAGLHELNPARCGACKLVIRDGPQG